MKINHQSTSSNNRSSTRNTEAVPKACQPTSRALQTASPSMKYPHNSAPHRNTGKYAGLLALETIMIGSGAASAPFYRISESDIKDIITSETLTPALSVFLKNFGSSPDSRFMIRSDAHNEDLAGQTNAGAYLTEPNIKNCVPDIIEAIKKVYASFSKDTAITQSKLYNSDPNTQTHQRRESLGDIIVHLMIGERPGDKSTVPASGVALADDPASLTPGTFKISSVIGHNEGCVKSLVSSDTTIGTFHPDTHELIAARAQVVRKPTRMAPPNDEQPGLVITRNAKEFMYAPTINQASLQTIATIMARLRKRHSAGADFEWTLLKNQVWGLQERSQDKRRHKAEPSYLPNEYTDALQDDQTIKVITISYGNYGVKPIKPTELLVSASLDDAFFEQYLPLKKTSPNYAPSLVAVAPPANGNCHAALMFRSMGIPIVCIESSTELARLADNKNTLLLDEQRGLIVIDPPSDNETHQGWFSYPCSPIYSMVGESSPWPYRSEASLNALLEIANDHQHVLPNTPTELLAQLRDHLTSKEQNRYEIIRLLANLLRKAYALSQIKITHPLIDQMRVLHEITVDIIRLHQSIQYATPLMHQLLYFNWLSAGFLQMPNDSPESLGIASFKSVVVENQENRKTNRVFDQWINHHNLLNAFNNHDRATRGCIRLLHRFSYATQNQSVKNEYLHHIASFLVDHTVTADELQSLAKRLLHHAQCNTANAFLCDLLASSPKDQLTVSDFLAIQHAPNPSLQKLKHINDRLNDMASGWRSPSHFNQLAGHIQAMVPDIHAAFNSANKDKPHEAIILHKQVSILIEQIDIALKTILIEPDYGSNQASHFKQLLSLLYEIATPILNQIYGNSRAIPLKMFHESFQQILDQSIDLLPSRKFNVSEAIIDSSIRIDGAYHCQPKTISDLHTLLHQNTRMALGSANLNIGAMQCLPSPLQNFNRQLNRALDTTTKTNNYQLCTITSDNNTHQICYALPLRHHGFRLLVEYNENEELWKFRIAMDGDDECHRYKLSTELFMKYIGPQQSLTKTAQGKHLWPDQEIASVFTIGWQNDAHLNNIEKMARDVAGILNTLAEITYSFTNTHAMGADRIDHDFATIYLNLTQHYEQFLENPSDNKNRRELASLINYYIIPISDAQFNDVARIMANEGITMNAYQFIQCLYALSHKNSQPLVTKHLPFFFSLPYRQASQLCAYLRQNRTADHLLPTIKRQLPEAYWLSTATFELTLALNHEEEEHATDLQTTSDTPFKPVKSAFIEYLDQINHREPIPDHIQPILSAQLQDLMHLNGSKLHAYLSGIQEGKTEVVHFFDNNLGLINRAESHVVRKLCSFSEQDMADINTLLTTLKTLETPTAHRTLLLYVIAGDINPSHRLIPAITNQVEWISTLGFYRFVKILEAARTLPSDKFSLISQFGKTIENLSPHCIAPLLQTFRSYDLEDLTTVDWKHFFGLVNQIDSNHKHNKNTYDLLIELLMSNALTKDHQLIESIFEWIGNDEDQLLHYLLSELNDNTRAEISNIVSNRGAFKDLDHKTMKGFLRSLFKCDTSVRAAFLGTCTK